MVRVAEDLSGGKKLQGLEMGVLYTKIPDSIKKEIIDPYISIENNEARIGLRILDSKDEGDKKLFSDSPLIIDFLDRDSKEFFQEIKRMLMNLDIKFDVNPFLVRGLDYYNHTAFEYIFSESKSQNTVLAGGRYDGLVKSLGGKDLCGIGWAAGIERILMIMDELECNQKIIGIFTISN